MRTPSIDVMAAKISKLETQVAKLDAKRAELAELREKFANLVSKASPDALREQIARKEAEQKRLAAILASLPADDSTETESE